MDALYQVWDVISKFILDGAEILKFCTNPLFTIGGVRFNIFGFVSLAGIAIYLGVAVVKWILS